MNATSSWFRGLKGKLLFTAILPVMALVFVVSISYHGLTEVSDMLENAYTDVIPSVDDLSRLATLRSNLGYFYWATLGATEPKARKEYMDKAHTSLIEFKEVSLKHEANDLEPIEKENYQYIADHKDEFLEKSEEIIELLRTEKPENDAKARVLLESGQWHKLAIGIRDHLEKSINHYHVVVGEKNIQQKQLSSHIRHLNIGVGAVASIILFLTTLILAHRVSTAIGATAKNLQASGSQITLAISQLSEAGNALSQSAVSAAASLEETAASLEEMNSTIKLSSGNAGQASNLSQTSSASAEEGEKEIRSLIGSMHEISESSKKIEEIINVIDDIAFQTNLLALNASVEAARAGEQGKGFAVVAEAVRTLAHKSAGAAKDITGLIRDSVGKIEKGTSVADRSGEVLSKIVVSVKKVADLNKEIAGSSQDQTHGISQINQAMNNLDQASQSNAASSEEIASTAEEIAAQAIQMQNAVELLNGIVLGTTKSSSDKKAA